MILLKCFSVLCRRVSILLFEIPDELGCIGIADGITDFIELLVRDLEQLFCLLQLKITKDLGKGNAPGSEPEFSLVKTEQRYRENGGNSSLVYHITDMDGSGTTA